MISVIKDRSSRKRLDDSGKFGFFKDEISETNVVPLNDDIF